jgi:hypothetical protein
LHLPTILHCTENGANVGRAEAEWANKRRMLCKRLP